MKLDRRNLRHWVYLARFAAVTACATLLRWLWPRAAGGPVLFYGHKLNGNLAAVLDAAQATPGFPPVAFLTMDPVYHQQLIAEGKPSVLATSLAAIPALARTRAVVSDHGLHALELMQRMTRLPVFDVWHGIPFKGFDADDFRVQRRFSETWVSSPLLASLYVERFGFEPERVVATGYARTDRLVRREESPAALRAKFGLEGLGERRIVLFAPTWKQDASGRSIFPFGVDAQAFFGAMESVCRESDACLVLRSHLNTGAVAGPASDWIRAVPHATHPDTEGLLLLSDVLVCDWSSIAFDYLLLDRPTLFLDVPPPFAKGFSLGPEYRFGALVESMDALRSALARYLSSPADYLREHGDRHAQVRSQVYAGLADGASSARCLARLERALASRGSSR